MEPAPLVIAEAASLEVPTIAAGHGGIAEFIDDKVSGLYFRPGDPESLARAINILEDDPVMAEELGKNAADNIKKMGMDNRSYLKKLLDLYYNILK
jgi:glycosyltransferase involved in cell wall biosynthesis